MRTEYKRDMNHNYLVIHGENEINTDSYQVRMLAGNVIPSLLKCRIQGMDGRFLFYFDITSKQAVSALYDEKKMEIEDLRLIFSGFVKAMEDAAEYLINPGQLIMLPEYIYTDIEKRQLYFCMLPGYDKDIKEQFQLLTEYILPKIDHQDQEAVILGYGVYKRAMEDSFHLEHVKEELYKIQGTKKDGEKKERTEKTDIKTADQESRFCAADIFPEKDEPENGFIREGEALNESGCLKKTGIIILAAVLIFGLAAAILMGYLPHMETGTILGAVLIVTAGVMLGARIMKSQKVHGISGQKPVSGETDGWTERNLSVYQEQINDRKEMPDCGQEKSMPLQSSQIREDYGETVVLSVGAVVGPASLVSKEPGELATIYLNDDLTVIGKLETACDAVINLPTVSRIHAKIRKKEENYFLTDMNSRNGTAVNGRLLLPDEEYQLEAEDEVDFAQARYIFLE